MILTIFGLALFNFGTILAIFGQKVCFKTISTHLNCFWACFFVIKSTFSMEKFPRFAVGFWWKDQDANRARIFPGLALGAIKIDHFSAQTFDNSLLFLILRTIPLHFKYRDCPYVVHFKQRDFFVTLILITCWHYLSWSVVWSQWKFISWKKNKF